MAPSDAPVFRFSDAGLSEVLARVGALAERAGGRALWVGGAVRDACLGRPVDEVDVEIFDVDAERFAAALAESFGATPVGRAFPVWKLAGGRVDVSLAGAGVDLDRAARRRDFTLNALAFDPGREELLDRVGGLRDLSAGVLRHTSERFGEDPLRVLRGMQLVARFALEPAPETVARCRQLVPDGLAAERVFEEWRKLLLRGVEIGRGLRFLQDVDWLEHAPELAALVGCPQDPGWHPEGDVWVHTGHCLDFFAKRRSGDDRADLIVGLGVLCHDLGKPATTETEAGRIRSKGHDAAGLEPTRRFLARMTRETELRVQVPRLVATHLAPSQLFAQQSSDAAVRRLARRAGSIAWLVRVAAADFGGRPPLAPEPYEAGEWLLGKAAALGVLHEPPAPLLQGRHLVSLGATPGPDFGPLLEAAYEAQLDGAYADPAGALDWARARLDASGN